MKYKWTYWGIRRFNIIKNPDKACMERGQSKNSICYFEICCSILHLYFMKFYYKYLKINKVLL